LNSNELNKNIISHIIEPKFNKIIININYKTNKYSILFRKEPVSKKSKTSDKFGNKNKIYIKSEYKIIIKM
jgi:hypothetical protein